MYEEQSPFFLPWSYCQVCLGQPVSVPLYGLFWRMQIWTFRTSLLEGMGGFSQWHGSVEVNDLQPHLKDALDYSDRAIDKWRFCGVWTILRLKFTIFAPWLSLLSSSSKQHPSFLLYEMATESVILVTGGSGLVGKAIQWVIENDPSERYGKKAGEQWIFLTSKDGDLRYSIEAFLRFLRFILIALWSS